MAWQRYDRRCNGEEMHNNAEQSKGRAGPGTARRGKGKAKHRSAPQQLGIAPIGTAMAKQSIAIQRTAKANEKSKEEGKKMLQCEGYKMFKGTMRLLARLPGAKDILYTGTWLYRPDNRMWYLNGCPDYPFGTSFHEDRVQIVEEVG